MFGVEELSLIIIFTTNHLVRIRSQTRKKLLGNFSKGVDLGSERRNDSLSAFESGRSFSTNDDIRASSSFGALIDLF